MLINFATDRKRTTPYQCKTAVNNVLRTFVGYMLVYITNQAEGVNVMAQSQSGTREMKQ